MEHQKLIMKKWDKQWGDRLNELVIIGQDMDEQQLIGAELENCLLQEDEIKRHGVW